MDTNNGQMPDTMYFDFLLDEFEQADGGATALPLVFQGDTLDRLARLERTDAGRFHETLARLNAKRVPVKHVLEALQSRKTRQGSKRAVVVTMESVTAKPVEWLWWPYISRGGITLLDGDPGLGKSLFTMQLAACISRGWPLPDQLGRATLPTGPAADVLLLSAEDSLAHTIKPRLDAAGCDPARVQSLRGWLDPEDTHHAFTLQHVEVLHAQLAQRPYALVVIDPIQAYIGDIDMHRANETRPVMQELRTLAETFQVAILCVRHPTKAAGNKAIYRGLGSIDILAAARQALYAEQHPLDRTQVYLAQSKNNVGILGRTQCFSKRDGHFQWSGVSRLSADDLAGAGHGPEPASLLAACCWLETLLQGSLPMPSRDVMTRAEERGIAKKTLERAKSVLGIKSIKAKEHWDWTLTPLTNIPPPPPLLLPDDLEVLDSQDSLGSLGDVDIYQHDTGVGQDRQISQEHQEPQDRQVPTRAPEYGRATNRNKSESQHFSEDSPDDVPF
jgi:hypothetical protein